MDSRFNQPIQLELSITVSGKTVGRIAELLRELLSVVSIRSGSVPSQAVSKPQQPEELVIDRSQTAKLLKVHQETVSRMAQTRRMPKAIRFGRALRWRRDEIEAWVKSGCPPMGSWTYPQKP